MQYPLAENIGGNFLANAYQSFLEKTCIGVKPNTRFFILTSLQITVSLLCDEYQWLLGERNVVKQDLTFISHSCNT